MTDKKELMIRPNGMNFEIYYEGGGQLPNHLTGIFTSEGVAQKAIDLFQMLLREKVKKTTPKRATTNAKSASN